MWYANVAVAAGLLIDIGSFALQIRKLKRGYGSSGLPLIPIYFYGVPGWTSHAVLTNSASLDSWLLVVFHVLFRYVIPRGLGKAYGRKSAAAK